MNKARNGGTDAKRSELCKRNACGGCPTAAARSGTTASFRHTGLQKLPSAEVLKLLLQQSRYMKGNTRHESCFLA